MTDTKLTHEDLQAVKKYVAYRFFCTCAVNIVILANCIRFIVDKDVYESIKMVIRVITYGSMAGVFMWSASARGQGDIDKKLSELKNSPQGVRLKQRFTSSNIIGFVAIGIGLIALYLMLQGIGNELFSDGYFC